MNKTCLGLIVAIVSINPACLFAQQDITPTSRLTAKPDVTGDYIDSSYIRFKDYTSAHGSTDTCTGKLPDPALYYPIPIRFFPFKDYPSPQKTAEELILFIQERLNKAGSSMVDLTFDDSTGNIKIHYGQSGRGWIINVRDIKPENFVWKKSGDNSSVRLGGMGSRKFNCASEQDAQDIESAFTRICKMNGWTPSGY